MTLMDARKADTSSRKPSQNAYTRLESRRKRSLKPSSSSKSYEKKRKEAQGTDQEEVAKDLQENFPIIRDNFDVLSKVGEGTFSTVYLAQLKPYPDEIVAIKHIVPTSSPTRVKNELACLQKLGGKRNIIGVKTTLRNNDHIAFILPYFKHDKFQTFFRRLTTNDIKDYMKNLFAALEHVHQYNIIHRDVKPSNFLHSRETKRYSLVDFGLAMQVPGTTGILTDENKSRCSPRTRTRYSSKDGPAPQRSSQSESAKSFVKNSMARGERCASKSTRQRPESHMKSQVLCKIGHQPGHSPTSVCSLCCSRSGQVAPRAGTPGFRSPEVLMKLPDQTTAVDIWSAGIILLSFLSGRYPFFKAKDDLSSLAQIITVFGSKEAAAAGNLMGKDLTCSPSPPPFELKSLCERLRQKTCKCNELSRNKRKYSSGEGRSKRAKIDSMSDKCQATGSKNASIGPKHSTVDSSTNQSRIVQGGSAQSTVTSDSRNPCKQKDLQSVKNLDKLTNPVDNNAISIKPVSDVDTGKAEVQKKDIDVSYEVPGDCFCIPDSAYDLLSKCLKLDPAQRITASDALNHDYLAS